VHGGLTPRGMASVHTTHGRYSKDLPTRLAGRYQQAMADPQLGMLHSEIALLVTRIGGLVSQLDTGQYGGDLWQELTTAYQAARHAKDGTSMAAALNDLGEIIKLGSNEHVIWDEIIKVVEQLRKLTDSERKRQMDLEQVITAERAMLLVSAISGVIKEHVTDKHQLAAISADIGALITIGASITSG